jgi:hypothetical protein
MRLSQKRDPLSQPIYCGILGLGRSPTSVRLSCYIRHAISSRISPYSNNNKLSDSSWYSVGNLRGPAQDAEFGD